MIAAAKLVGAWIAALAMLVAFSALMSFAIISPSNPINLAWAAYVCGEHMTEAERASEPRCP